MGTHPPEPTYPSMDTRDAPDDLLWSNNPAWKESADSLTLDPKLTVAPNRDSALAQVRNLAVPDRKRPWSRTWNLHVVPDADHLFAGPTPFRTPDRKRIIWYRIGTCFGSDLGSCGFLVDHRSLGAVGTIRVWFGDLDSALVNPKRARRASRETEAHAVEPGTSLRRVVGRCSSFHLHYTPIGPRRHPPHGLSGA